MKSVLLEFCCLGAVLLTALACQKLTPDDGVYKVRIPVDNGEGHYVFQTKELRTVTNLSTMEGSTAVFKSNGRFDIDLEFDGKAEVTNSNVGNTPAAQFVRSNGVYVPADYVSLTMAAAMYHFEAIRNFYDNFGANKDIKFPRMVLINVVEAYRRGEEQMVSSNNAAYVPSMDLFFINPYNRPDVPLPLNGGVLAHEYLHSVFAKKFNTVTTKLRDQGLITPDQFESMSHIMTAFRLNEWKTAKPFVVAERDRRNNNDDRDRGGTGPTGDGSGNDHGNGRNGSHGHNHHPRSGDGPNGSGSDTGDNPNTGDNSNDLPPTGNPDDSGEIPAPPAPTPPPDISMTNAEIRAANDLIFASINEGVADYYGYEYTRNPAWIVPSLPSQTFRDLSQEKTFTLSSLEQKKIIRKSIDSHDPEDRIDEHGLGAYFSHFLYIISSSADGWGAEKTERKTLDFLDRYATVFAESRDTRFISMGDLVRLYFADGPVPGALCPKIIEMFPAELNYSNLPCGGAISRWEEP